MLLGGSVIFWGGEGRIFVNLTSLFRLYFSYIFCLVLEGRGNFLEGGF